MARQALHGSIKVWLGKAQNYSMLLHTHPSFHDILRRAENIDKFKGGHIANSAANALLAMKQYKEAIITYGAALKSALGNGANKSNVAIAINNISLCLLYQNLLAAKHRIDILNYDLCLILDDKELLFINRLSLFSYQSLSGCWDEAKYTWKELDNIGRNWVKKIYREGYAESMFALNQFFQGLLQEEYLKTAEQLAIDDSNRSTLRNICRLRGTWRLAQQEWMLATDSFHESLKMARERGLIDEESETGLALAKVHLGQFYSPDEARHEAERLSNLREPAHHYLAMLWREIDDLEQAKKHAFAAYKWAWADGEPYVHRYELDKATELLKELNVPIPNLPPYDPLKDEPFPWEADLRKAIEELKTQKESKKKR
ncbi:hypothetical protein FGF66_09435 [Chlorobaculum thiosulfatiphilum]|uniref:Tetratricopeptide repeat protein n=1 Tax=Chlorobaculum thiosulfatiphilum TaxID=115852 RepID=A0A5C4S5S5_CHLTI|nr:hypothetical protein [Chlorobaculum thiosulfatiphilum]TNJ38379.1 hypothetical protein FGF66_09435 [Chlorobaculum thiosulfatiphilum]